jgi:2-polyprenyl-6-methoxyphenol hydroxylase-like FAD-dependent oxidoreductase
MLIAGGGIGGSALALAAQQCDLEAVIWERAPELREAGAGLLLTANAMRVLDLLGVGKAAAGVGQHIHTWQILDRCGRTLQTFTRGRDQPLSISITRASFHDTLRHALPADSLCLGHEVVSVEQPSATGKVIVRSANGDICPADLVIGADGGKSRVSESIFGHHDLRECGYVGWRALVDQVPEEWSNGRITESWGDGLRFGIAPVSETRSYWYATENVSSGWQVPPEQRRAHLLEKFRRWHRPICQLIEATSEDHILLNCIAEHSRRSRWSRGRVALLGDAAHLMTPNLGQGAAMALEDAWVLADCLRQDGPGERALRHYERRRHWRAAYIVWQSRQVGRMIQVEHPWLCGLRDTAVRLTPDSLAMLSMAPVFRFHA